MTRLTKTAIGPVLAAFCLAGNAQEASETTETPETAVVETSIPYPLDYFAMRPVIRSVSLSPDGKYLALMKIPAKDADPVVEVYEAADLTKEPFRMNADPMEITGLRWVSDTDIVFDLRQQVTDKIEGFNQGTFRFKLGLLNMATKELKEFEELGISVAHRLAHEPNKIIISMVEGDVDGRLGRTFRPRSYWELNLKRGSKRLLIRGKASLGNITFDGQGNPWLARGFDERKRELIWYWRPPGTSNWEEFRREHVDEFAFYPFRVAGLDPDKPNHALVIARNGHDTEGLWSYDLANKAFVEAIYRRADVDVGGVVGHSNPWENPFTVVGLWYDTDRTHVEYFDGDEQALIRQLEGLIPHAHDVIVQSRSRDGATLVVANFGPRDPGTYYLIQGGRLHEIGGRNPLLSYDGLADVEYVTYEARDGTKIPAYITIPHGEPPFPLVVMPHGGPFARDGSGYDEWAQMLANNGYLVIQPQFRGSTGFGIAHEKAAYENGGQQGRKMQDDKDDAATYLVDRKLADPDRLAMYGWSYGGYAALAAASRTPQLYQCVIAGAAVADPTMQINYYRFRFFGAVRDRLVKMDETAIQPIDEVAKVNVPMLIIHGSVDQRVPVDHARKYLKELHDHEKDYKYVELELADHFSNTLRYEHKIQLYESIVDYLANDCGPGGL
ncbi:MAG: S9 family peptidase [Gammaproteobacteria bacterium]|nr:S9 family peptidase [Gammaproteobacteria bacterium]